MVSLFYITFNFKTKGFPGWNSLNLNDDFLCFCTEDKLEIDSLLFITHII